MIYEIRTYTLKVGTVAACEKVFGEAYVNRQKHSQLAGFFHTEIGPLNEIIHIWPYADIAERTRIRAEAAKDGSWPPKIAEFIEHQKVEIVNAAPFVPEWKPGKDGPVYELRQYQFKAGSQSDILKTWEPAVPERIKRSPLVLAGILEMGPTVNSWIHIWAYPSLQARGEIRAKAAADGIWPPKGAPQGTFFNQTNKIMLPSEFSPAQ